MLEDARAGGWESEYLQMGFSEEGTFELSETLKSREALGTEWSK